MTDEQQPFFSTIPKSTIEAIAASPLAKPADLAKAALREHIRRFVDDNLLKQLTNFLVPVSIEWTTKSLPKEHNLRTLMIESLIMERQIFPAINVSDSGSTPKTYLGSSTKAFENNGRLYYQYEVEKTINFEIIYADGDYTSCNELRTFLGHIFGKLADFTNTYILQSNPDEATRWQLLLPMASQVDEGTITRQSIGDDNVQSYYYGSMSFPANFEAATIIGTPKGRVAPPSSGRPQYQPFKPYTPKGIPSILSMSQQSLILVHIPKMYMGLRARSTNSNLLAVQTLTNELLQLAPLDIGAVAVEFMRGQTSVAQAPIEITI